MKVDVVVVGASACGGLAARSAAKRGAKTILLEEDAVVGKFNKCSGLFSKNGLKQLNVDYDACVLHEITGAEVYAGKNKFTVQRKNIVALVLDRQKLDEEIVNEAISAGVVLKTKCKVTNKINANTIATSAGGEFNFKYLIGCDGVSSSIASLYSFPSLKNSLAIGYEAEYVNARAGGEELVKVFLDKKMFPGFFGWVIPAGKTVRLGFGTTNYKTFTTTSRDFFHLPIVSQITRDSRKVREFTHAIPLKLRSVTEKQSVFLAGDAAGQVKSTTGGGVVLGGQCAMLAGEIASHNCNCVCDDNSKTRSYEKEWRQKFGKTFATHAGIRKTFNALPSPLVNLSVLGFDKLFLYKLLEKFGDMDYVTKC
ncbi:MAG: NAD(P)/FAD-dependent oxidoreductase [Candidatus Micrarchaeota archaeon]